MRQCTWKPEDGPRCSAEANHAHVHTRSQQQLADLCADHQRLLNKGKADVQANWIAAQGGSEIVAENWRKAEETF